MRDTAGDLEALYKPKQAQPDTELDGTDFNGNDLDAFVSKGVESDMKDETRAIEAKQRAQQAREERRRREAEAEERRRKAAKPAPKPVETENEYTKIVDYQPIPESSDDSVRGVYNEFQLAQKPKPIPKPLPPPPKIKSRQERIYEKVEHEMKKKKTSEVDPDDIQIDKGDFDGTVNSNVDDYAEFLSAKATYGDKSKKSDDDEEEQMPVPQSMTMVDHLSGAEKAQLEVTPIDTNAPKVEPVAPVQPKQEEDEKVEAYGNDYLTVEQLQRARQFASMTTKEKEHQNAALSENDIEPDDLDLAL